MVRFGPKSRYNTNAAYALSLSLGILVESNSAIETLKRHVSRVAYRRRIVGHGHDYHNYMMTNISESLRHLATPIEFLTQDPANCRLHPQLNLDAIAASLRVYGQRKPVIVNRRTGIVEAGNGTLVAAVSLGWTHLAAVHVDDDPSTAAGFAIADNRSAELAQWSPDLGRMLQEMSVDDDGLQRMFDDLKVETAPQSKLPVLENGVNSEKKPFFSFGTHRVPLTEDELARIDAAVDRYIGECGSVDNFILSLLTS